MPPYDNRMQLPGMGGFGMPQQPPGMSIGMPGGGGIDPQMFQQYLRIMQQQGQGPQQGPGGQPGMQNMSPDQGMNQAPGNMGIPGQGPSAPPGWGGGGIMRGMGQYAGQIGQPGGPLPEMSDAERGMQMGPAWMAGGPNGRFGMQKPMMNPGMPGGSGPFMPPGMEPGQGQLQQKPMMRPPHLGGPGMGPGQQSPPIQAQPQPRMPPMPRPPPNAEVYQMPGGKMMNQTPIFSGANNPYDGKPDQNTPPGLAPGPASDVPGGLSSPADPIRVPMPPTSGTAPQDPGMVTNMDKPRKAQGGSAPFNPGNPQKQAEASGRKWQPSKPATREQKKADVSTRKFTSAAVR